MSTANCGNPVWNALPDTRAWTTRPSRDDLRALPDRPAVYVLADANATPIQLATTQSLRRALLARVAEPAVQNRRADVAEIARQVHWRALHTAFEARWWYYRLARELYPREYRRMVSFGPAYFLHVDWAAAVPEMRLSDAVWTAAGEFLGPWPTQRAGQTLLDGLVDLFDLCRYPERVRQTPRGTRCAYADMGRCDAPCDGSVPLPIYIARCREAWAFARGATQEWIAGAEAKMHAAARQHRFEIAAIVKEQLAFARRWAATPAANIVLASEMNEAVLLPATRRRAWKLLRFQKGEIVDGPLVAARALPRGAIAWLASDVLPATPATAEMRTEQTWLWCSLRAARAGESSLLLHLGRGSAAEWEQTISQHMEKVALAQAGARLTEEPAA